MGIEGVPVLDTLGRQQSLIDPHSLDGAVSVRLPSRPESVRGARDFTRTTLAGWRLSERFDTVALVVSELVTNALRHGCPESPAPARVPAPAPGPGEHRAGVRAPRPRNGSAPVRGVGARTPRGVFPGEVAGSADLASVELELLRSNRRLVCAVRDCGEQAPRPARADASMEGGRGLHLVECFSDGWGWRPLSDGRRGKVVWAAFRLG
ncbi:ATP-binding protein [Streptomyces calidiresistens]|uniref:ATP-binding protein n=1 Tax=Streptomyces calidiresistens TaxID=1485586 RepID=A0A7W3T105_9ACTN|nr:ATP-binding protein [Streptomyces calidiresistens]MBB0228919.1 ATP-binding protein [Streptomyces calidiresistens]